ncbi:MAG: peptide chain release factor 1 [Candidatus Aureabacteria bacterium]|nr:peptide chain release factor 1 [Candidatus Auribacterota bacterium]
MNLLDKKKLFEDKKTELEKLLASPDIINAKQRYQKTAREHAHVLKVLSLFESFEKCLHDLEANRALHRETDDSEAELLSFIQDDIAQLERLREELEKKIIEALLPKGENEGRNIIIEIRAGTGGEEASLFAADIYRMYVKYAEKNGFQTEPLGTSPSDKGGFKEIIFSIKGEDVFSRFRFESGTHRVQRVPVTESSGRIHTSAITVAILPEAEDIDVSLDTKDLRIDTFRASGHGGQSVNTMDSAIRITHLPTKIVVSCQDERSQFKNKEKAIRILKARLFEKKQREEREKRSRERKSQVGTGDRSEKIRTYNFPQNRVTDHRINLTLYSLDHILDGNMEDIVLELSKAQYEKSINDPSFQIFNK